MYKIAISDLDGTLLGPDHKLSSVTKSSVHNWIENGRQFVIATGRHYIEAKKIQDELGDPIYLITSNGARVHNQQGDVILKQNLPADIASAICSQTFDSKVQVNLFTDQYWYANFSLQELVGMTIDTAFYCRPVDLTGIDHSDTIKIFFWGERKKLNIIHQQLAEQFGSRVNLTFSLERCLEVMEANTNKGAAVDAVLKQLKLNTEQAIAFGDGMNDVEMLNCVGKPILMANSQKDLKKALPQAEIGRSSTEHGVAVKLDMIIDNSNA